MTRALILSLVALLGAVPAGAHRQEPVASPAADSQSPPVFRSHANLVTLQVNVFDRRSQAVTELPQAAFRVYEDGVEQDIQFFADREVPVAVGLVMDNSSSMIARRDLVHAGVTAFADSSREADEMFTIVFNEHVRFGLPESIPFTRDHDLLLSAFTRFPAGGLTALHDAVISGLAHLAEASHQKRVLVVLSDGDDNASHASESNMLYRAAQSNALIYTIWTGDLTADRGNPRLLRTLAQRSGGVAYGPRSERETVSAFAEVAENVRRGYSIGYTPSNSAADGTYRHVKVIVTASNRTLNVRTRDGYIAPDDRVEQAERGGAGDRE
jgi:VWFA-related protein